MTRDTPATGVVVAQPDRGYRYAADAFLLAGLAARSGPVGTALDLGTGCGVIPLLLARRGYITTGVEAQAAWAGFWAASLADSSVTAELVVGRVQDLDDGRFDVVTCNPPYTPAGRGLVSPDALKAAAHTELDGTLIDFVAAAERSVSEDGRVVFIVPLLRVGELEEALGAVGLHVAERIDVGRKRSLLRASRREVEAVHAEVPARGAVVDALYAEVIG